MSAFLKLIFEKGLHVQKVLSHVLFHSFISCYKIKAYATILSISNIIFKKKSFPKDYKQHDTFIKLKATKIVEYNFLWVHLDGNKKVYTKENRDDGCLQWRKARGIGHGRRGYDMSKVSYCQGSSFYSVSSWLLINII